MINVHSRHVLTYSNGTCFIKNEYYHKKSPKEKLEKMVYTITPIKR